MSLWSAIILLSFAAATLAFTGEFVPKSYYTIDHNGHRSDVIYFRSKRDVELFPLLRVRRGGSSSSSSASSSSSSSGGGYQPNGAQASSFASASSSSSSGVPSGQGGLGGVGNTGYQGPILFSRFGEDTGTGVDVSGSAQGQKGAFSQSSSSIDSDGKIKYSVQSGKY